LPVVFIFERTMINMDWSHSFLLVVSADAHWLTASSLLVTTI
jgi:hypothetical protein